MHLGFKRVLLGPRVAASENTSHFADHPLWADHVEQAVAFARGGRQTFEEAAATQGTTAIQTLATTLQNLISNSAGKLIKTSIDAPLIRILVYHLVFSSTSQNQIEH